MKFNNKVYNVMKWIALILLPALSTLIMAIGDIWGIPYKEQISLTVTAVDTFIGALIAISTASYAGEGTLEIVANSEETNLVLNADDALKEAQKSGKILLAVETVEE